MYARTVIALALALVSVSGNANAQVRPAARIGIIDSRALMQGMPGRVSAEAQFLQETARAREMVHTATDALRAAVDDLARAERDLRPQQREAAIMIIRARELALEDMVSQLNLLAQRRLDELQAPMRTRLGEAVRTVRAREKLSIVVDLAAGPGIIDADEALNITPLVLKELQRPDANGPAR